MRVDKFTYAKAESCLYESMRVYLNKNGELETEREGKALLDATMTQHNVSYVHPCLRPLVERGAGHDYQRGQAIADYHNSRVSSKQRNAVMHGDDKQMSKAIGFIITLPKDFIQEAIPELTDDEFFYLQQKMEAEGNHGYFRKMPEMEEALNAKFSKHEWTADERAVIQDFLTKAKDAMIAEMGVKDEDVLFWSLHFDESFPHVHVMTLPSVEKSYDHDVYSKKLKKDGTYTLLHKAGEKETTFSVERFYEKNKNGEYVFFKDLHERVIARMDRDYSIDASGLLNDATREFAFTPSVLDHNQREKSVKEARMILALQNKVKKLEALLEEKEIEIEEKTAQISRLKKVIKELKDELKRVIESIPKAFPALLMKFAEKWKRTKENAVYSMIDAEAEREAKTLIAAQAAPVMEAAERAEALLQEDTVAGINMATFERSQQKIGFAKKQVTKAAEAAGKAEAFEANEEAVEVALGDWFSREKYEPVLEGMTTDEAKAFMSNPERARRALEAVEMEFPELAAEAADEEMDSFGL